MKRLAAVLASVLVLAGCASVDAGEVVSKKHYPMHVVTTTIVCGKSMCPSTYVSPESWELWVCEGEPLDADRTCEWWSVSHERYDATQIGDHVTKNPS